MKPVGKITSNLAGRMYVGVGAKKTVLSNGSARYISKDGLQAYRTPVAKSNGKFQSNFEKFVKRPVSNKQFKFPNRLRNIHLNVRR